MDAADIVDVVKEFVTLRKAGVNYKGLCPFHNEKTPSFTVSPAKQMCKCFSCGKGGNVVHFLMELENMTYPEALKWLGRKYGIEVKEKELTDEEKLAQNERESMFALNEWANKYFQDILHNNVDGVAKGMAYFRSRGFRDDIIKKFSLGYSPETRDAMYKAAMAHGFKEDYLVKTGLCYRTEDGRMLDRYHGRVIFPVHTVSGKVVAFGGRILSTDKKLAKYVNSPESEIYSKSNELYGLYQAKQAIVRQGRCFLVEGYTDVISMHQSGVENVVASSGTSLTQGQIRLLHRFTEHITVLYDGDAAGIKASMRGIDMLLAEGLKIKVLLLPDGDDPDSFAKKHRAEEFQAYIEQHQVDFIKFKTELLFKDAEHDPIKRAELVTNIVKSISVIPDRIIRQMYIHECATAMSVSESLIVNEINRLYRAKTREQEKAEDTSSEKSEEDNKPAEKQEERSIHSSVISEEERLLVTLLVRYAGLLIDVGTDDTQTVGESEETASVTVAQYIADNLENDGLAFRSAACQKVLKEACANARPDGTWDSLPYFLAHPDPEVSNLASEVGQDDFELSTHQREQYIPEKDRLYEIVPHILHDFKHMFIKEQLQSLLLQLRNPELMHDPQKAEAIMRDYMCLCEIDREFAHKLGERILLK